MVHGGYKCCAICDNKVKYVETNESFKDRLCKKCKRLTNIQTVKQLHKEINSFDKPQDLISYLRKIKYSPCMYNNKTDELIDIKLYGKIKEKLQSFIDLVEILEKRIDMNRTTAIATTSTNNTNN